MLEKAEEVTIRPMEERDLDEADRVTRLAFGTFLKLPDPLVFMGDCRYIHTRWKADPSAALTAEADGQLIGSCFASCWGSVGFFGPLTVRPDYWDKGVAQQLLNATLAIFDRWQIETAGLFTFAQSTKHVHVYQKFGFWPQQLTCLTEKAVCAPAQKPHWTGLSAAGLSRQADLIESCRALTHSIYPGLDLAREIQSAAEQQLGETALLWEGETLAGLAVCHCGPGTEAGSDTCYVKFGAVLPGGGAGERFEKLIDSCEALAAERGLSKMTAGINTSHHDAYRRMLARGFRPFTQGVVMQRDNKPGYRRPDAYVIDDWR